MLKMLHAVVCICLISLSGCGCHVPHYKNNLCNDEIGSLQEPTRLFGTVKVQNKTYKRLNVNGSIDACHVAIDKDLFINGAMTANNIRIRGNLIVNGSSIMHNAGVMGKTQISGSLEAIDSAFSQVEANTTELIFKNSTATSIIIRKPHTSDHKPQIVILDHTTIHENITFEKAGGKVVVRNGAVIKGSIIGGEEQK